MTVGSCFAGIGGFDLGFQQAGFETTWTIEIDEDCNELLGKRLPDALRYGDIRSATARQIMQPLSRTEAAGSVLPTEEQSRGATQLVQSVLSNEAQKAQREQGGAERKELSSAIRLSDRGCCKNDGTTEREMRDLPENDDEALRGSLPQDRAGSGTSLPRLQHPAPSRGKRRISEEIAALFKPPLAPVDIVCGGFPCQDLSVAGRREGLKGARSSMFFEFVRIVREMREATNGQYPTFALLENVPGLLSSNRGRDFAVVLRELAIIGALDIGWAILDAQWFGVAQRRQRVFIVADFGGRRAEEILSLSESLRWNPAPSREARKDVAGTFSARTNGGGGLGTDFECDGGLQVSRPPTASPHGYRSDCETETMVAHTLRGEGFDASEDGTGRGTPLVTASQVRRLTPKEAARLQGFPDDWLEGLGFSDSTKYRMLGNAVCVPVAAWIAQRLRRFA